MSKPTNAAVEPYRPAAEEAAADPNARANRFVFQAYGVIVLLILCIAMTKYVWAYWAR